MIRPEEWGEYAEVIICYKACRPGAVVKGSMIIHCECCGEEVFASPVAVAKLKDPNWHVSCIDCMEDTYNAGEEVKIAGYVGAKEVKKFPEGSNPQEELEKERAELEKEVTRIPAADYYAKTTRRSN